MDRPVRSVELQKGTRENKVNQPDLENDNRWLGIGSQQPSSLVEGPRPSRTPSMHREGSKSHKNGDDDKHVTFKKRIRNPRTLQTFHMRVINSNLR